MGDKLNKGTNRGTGGLDPIPALKCVAHKSRSKDKGRLCLCTTVILQRRVFETLRRVKTLSWMQLYSNRSQFYQIWDIFFAAIDPHLRHRHTLKGINQENDQTEEKISV